MRTMTIVDYLKRVVRFWEYLAKTGGTIDKDCYRAVGLIDQLGCCPMCGRNGTEEDCPECWSLMGREAERRGLLAHDSPVELWDRTKSQSERKMYAGQAVQLVRKWLEEEVSAKAVKSGKVR